MGSTKFTIIVGVALLAVWSCQRDRTVNTSFPSTIEGDYIGTYRYLQIRELVDTNVNYLQPVDIRFRNGLFLMSKADPSSSPDGAVCDVSGEYTVGTGVELTVVDTSFLRELCTPHWGPTGYFDLYRETGSIRLLSDRIDSDGIRMIREFNLTPRN